MYDVNKELEKAGIIPVVAINDADKAVPMAKALVSGGLPVIEVTFRTEAAEQAIKNITAEVEGAIVIAGTVLTVEQAERAVNAGARGIVAPGLNPKTALWCKEHDVPFCPGVQTPSEIEQALDLGITYVKFFPAEPAGGLKMIKAVAAPYTMMHFMPTGGLNAENVKEYLKYDKIFACGGSWIAKGSLIDNNEFDKIEELAKEASAIVKEIRG